GDSGLRRFLVTLARESPRAIVRIVSQVPDRERFSEEAVEQAVDELVPTLRRGGIRELHLLLVPYNSFEHLAHARYVLFEDKVCISGTGLEVLEKERVRRRTSWQLQLHSQTTRRDETRLLERARLNRLWPLD